MADERPTVRRWAEAIGQNLVASALWLGAAVVVGALSLWLATEGAEQVTVRVWWIAAALCLLLLTWIWLAVLTVRLRASRPAPRPTAHPDDALLQRLDSLQDQLRGREGPVEWQLGQLYNAILAEVKRRPHDVSLASVQPATQSPTAVHLTAQTASVLSAGLATLRSAVGGSG